MLFLKSEKPSAKIVKNKNQSKLSDISPNKTIENDDYNDTLFVNNKWNSNTNNISLDTRNS